MKAGAAHARTRCGWGTKGGTELTAGHANRRKGLCERCATAAAAPAGDVIASTAAGLGERSMATAKPGPSGTWCRCAEAAVEGESKRADRSVGWEPARPSGAKPRLAAAVIPAPPPARADEEDMPPAPPVTTMSEAERRELGRLPRRLGEEEPNRSALPLMLSRPSWAERCMARAREDSA